MVQKYLGLPYAEHLRPDHPHAMALSLSGILANAFKDVDALSDKTSDATTVEAEKPPQRKTRLDRGCHTDF